MDFEKGNIYNLPVKEVRTENKRSFYIVEANGEEYGIPLFEFQKEDPKPDILSCLVKDIHENKLQLTQDFSPLLKRFYQEGEVYPFRVKSDFSQLPNGYYEVADWNGFAFRLIYFAGERLQIGQRIECRVRSLRENKLSLELVRKNTSEENLQLLTIEDVLEPIRTPAKLISWIKKGFKSHRIFRKAREAFMKDNEEWIIIAIQELDQHINSWIRPGRRGNSLLLGLFSKVCLYLLEDSDVLSSCSEQERHAYQRLLSGAARHAEIYQEAVRLINSGKHIQHIKSLLEKMQKSGYLYEPDRRLKVLMCIFSLDRNLMERNMHTIFDIILNGNKKYWMTEPFRSAFIEMLELFINESRNQIDRLASIENEDDQACLNNIIEALAIQLLLATDKDSFDRQLSRAMFYRYLTYVKGNKSELLFEKAFRSLTEANQENLEFNWKEVTDLTLLAIRTSSSLKSTDCYKTNILQSYNGNNCRLQIMNGCIRLRTNSERKQPVPVLPEWLLPWHQMQIYLPEDIKERITPKTQDLSTYQKFWKEVEYSLFSTPETFHIVRKGKKRKAEEGDIVSIRIMHQDINDSDFFTCRIQDDIYEGEGRISIRNIVRYTLRTEENTFFDANGKPYLLKAKVLSVGKDGHLNFTMQTLINEMVREYINVGDCTKCIIKDIHQNHYQCVSQNGYPLQVPVSEDTLPLNPGDGMEVEINNIRPSGTIEGELLRPVMPDFTIEEAFMDLIYTYADDKIYEEITDEKDLQQPEVTMEKPILKELIQLIDRKAVLEKDYKQAYNYLAFARVLSILIQEKENTSYYAERMKLLQVLQKFVINGQVDNEELMHLSEKNKDMANSYPMLKNYLLELQTISYIDYPEKTPAIWNTLTHTRDKHLILLCRLVLSYNCLSGFNMHEEREAIRRKINEMLNIEMEMPQTVYFGKENDEREYKTSVVYPPNNNMRPDLKTQTREIMTVICGFLNAGGGTLYLGVNNEGVAVGLEEDLRFFGGSLDKFDLHIRNHIALDISKEANSKIKVHYPEANGKTIYALDIEPCPHPVRVEGICYQRQGSSTWPLLDDDLKAFIESREKEYSQLTAGNHTHPDTSEQPAGAETETLKDETPKASSSALIEQIATSQIRHNPVEYWKDDYGIETVCYLHFMPKNEYLITYDTYWTPTALSLAIKEDEKDGYIILAYESGRVLRVPVVKLLDKSELKPYKRNGDDKLLFACPAHKDDALLSIVRSSDGRNSYRMDDVTNLCEGAMMDTGNMTSSVEHMGMIQCDIIPASYKHNIKRIYNLKPTQVGNAICDIWGMEDMQAIRSLGIQIPDK